MKECFEKLAAAIIYSDGEVAPSELSYLEKLASDFGSDKTSLVLSIEAEIEKLKPMDEEEFQEYMKSASKAITDPEIRYKVFDAMLELTLADNSLDDMETNVLGKMSQYLEIPIYYFANNLACKVKDKGAEIVAQKGWEKPVEHK
jgi:uncharacterized tellurite resistance protein B-like protein